MTVEHTDDAARRAHLTRLLRDRVNRELEAGRAFVEDRVGHLFPGLLGRIVNPLARTLYHQIGEAEVRRRANRQLDLLVAVVADAESRGMDAAFADARERLLATEELVHRANPHHPRFAEVKDELAATMRLRIDLLAGYLARGTGATFDEALVRAFPDRAIVEDTVRRQMDLGRDVVRRIEREPDLIRFPRALLRPLLALVGDVMTWYEARFREDLDRAYGAAREA